LLLIFERMFGSRCTLLQNSSLFMLVLSMRNVLRPPQILFPACLMKLYSCSSWAFCMNYLNIYNDIHCLCFRAECVSRGVLQMIREAPNGSIWVSEDEKPVYQVIISPRKSEWITVRKECLLTRRILGNGAVHWLPNR
jgi:hypothetical protein